MGKKKEQVVKVVLDTNILVPALLFGGELSKIIDLWKEGRIVPLFSKDTLSEFKTVLAYPKFSLTTQEIKAIIEEEALPYFEVVEVADKIKGVCRDADDDADKFIACAVAASADSIVTGDKALLEIGKYRSIKIVNTAVLLKMF